MKKNETKKTKPPAKIKPPKPAPQKIVKPAKPKPIAKPKAPPVPKPKKAPKPIIKEKPKKEISMMSTTSPTITISPIIEYDPSTRVMVEARDMTSARKRISRCLITYFEDIVSTLDAEGKAEPIFQIRTDGLRPRVYEMTVGTEIIYLLLTAGGASNAAKALEVMSALGVRKFMVCSGAGTINDKATLNNILLPTSAVRDEGTSYHYLAPAREVKMDRFVQKRIETTLQRLNIKYAEVKTWTTDAFFRLTEGKIQSRRREGCHTVDAETAAYFAVAEKKGLSCGQLLYAGELQKKDGWEYRIWHAATDLRTKLFDTAVKCLMDL